MSTLTRLWSNGEASVYGVLALLGLAAVAGGAPYGMFVDGGRVGPGFLPVVAGGLTAVLGGWVAFRSVTAPASQRHDAPPAATDLHLTEDTDGLVDARTNDDVDITGRTERERIRSLWKVFGLTFGAILLVQVVGFMAAFAGLVFVISTWIERQALLKSAVIAVIAAGLIYGVFGLFLKVPLPGGLFGPGTEG